jgi:outer membrane protein assembly factor BamB
MYRSDASPDRTLLVAAFGCLVFGLERSSGAVRWEVKLEGAEVEIAIADGVVIAATQTHLAFIDYATGALHKSVGLQGGWVGRPTMLVDAGHIYVGRNGEVSCYTLRGENIWLEPFKGKGAAAVALGLPGNVRQADLNT